MHLVANRDPVEAARIPNRHGVKLASPCCFMQVCGTQATGQPSTGAHD